MKVLIACEESQAVCKAFRELGHEAYSADIQECSGGHPEWHILGDVLPIIDGNCVFRTCDGKVHGVDGQWDLLIAHPPCTYLSNAGACRLYPKKGQIDLVRLAKGLAARSFFMKFFNAKCEHIAIENPMPSLIFELPEKSQVIQPYQFGEPYSKKTYLWLKGLPKLKGTSLITVYKPYVSCGTSVNKGNPEKSGVSRSGGAQKVRSKTFPSIAKAMAEQWSKYIEEV